MRHLIRENIIQIKAKPKIQQVTPTALVIPYSLV